MKWLLLPALTFLSVNIYAQEYYLLVGTYDSPKSEGIYVYRFNSKDGTASAISHVKTSNPSFLAVSSNEKYVYAVNENADSTKYTVTGHVASFSFNKKNGTLRFLNKQESGGKHPCYVAIDKKNKWVFAGNYSSGSFAILPVMKDGSLGIAKQTIQHEGSGPDKTRQQSPHVHGIFMPKGNNRVYVTDLGTDKIMRYNFNEKTGTVSTGKPPFIEGEKGGGARHLDIHPNGKYIYLLEELTGSVAVYGTSADTMAMIQTLAAFPPYYRGPAGSADIHVSPDGRFLYCSNRGQSNSIGIFSIDKETGMITLVDHQFTLGETPRNFNFDPTGKFLLVGNQNSDEIVIFSRDINTGLLKDTGNRISVGKPVCINWISIK